MKNFKKWLMGSGLLVVLLTLSGCVSRLADGSPNPEGLIYRFMISPLGNVLTHIAKEWHFGYGWAIIVITIIVRLIILPLGIHQSHKAMVQSEKMQYLKPQVEIAQANAKKAQTREEQVQAQLEMQKIYKENNVSMFGGIGCLPLLLQMPVFTALFYTARYTPGIDSATFYGINLGQSSLILVIIAGVAYALQGYISLIGVPEEQKKTMKSMLIVSPLMIVMMSFSSPAGVTLYWVVGGIIGCVQTFITNVLMKPRIKRKIDLEMKENPPKIVVTAREEVTPSAAETKTLNSKQNEQKNNRPHQGRNAGKQQKRR
ncbi:MAG: membrane protein insertase YidC [Enterococcus sp.]|nr:membrane protein insertase YidC [Enterococcus sp.]